MNALYPWLAPHWQRLLDTHQHGRLGHAILLSGRAGLGLEALALRFAQWRLCEQPTADGPYGQCRNCSLFTAGNHPDLKVVAPAEEGKAILIDQVRELNEYYTLTSHFGGAKIVLLHPADRMNRAAANAILKTLEEPPPGALLLLVAHNFSALPMTIRSRCVRLACEQLDVTAALDWLVDTRQDLSRDSGARLLNHCGGQPLTALDLADDNPAALEIQLLEVLAECAAEHKTPALGAQEFADLAAKDLIRAGQALVNRLILAKYGQQPYFEEGDPVPDPSLHDLADHLNLNDLYAFSDLLFESKALLERQSGLRENDIAESLILGLGHLAGAS